MADELELVFDTDPHEVNASGTQQTGEVAEDQAEAVPEPETADNGEDDTEDTDGPIA
jgi:hypothetical protein